MHDKITRAAPQRPLSRSRQTHRLPFSRTTQSVPAPSCSRRFLPMARKESRMTTRSRRLVLELGSVGTGPGAAVPGLAFAAAPPAGAAAVDADERTVRLSGDGL